VVLHADKDGTFLGLDIERAFYKAHVFQTDLWVKRGDRVSAFRGANDSLGTLVLNFDTEEELKQALNNQRNWLNVSVMGKNTPPPICK
jgi:hypothetical protein